RTTVVKKKTAQKVGAHAGVEGEWEVKVAHSAQDWRRAKEARGREHRKTRISCMISFSNLMHHIKCICNFPNA
ncbi:MAG: hypothetical protein WC076_13635, partial [Terrimicrobiaceae bacterium]